MTQTIVYQHGSPVKRVVRSQRLYHGALVGAIRDRGWLVMVRRDENGTWRPFHTIRKMK